jgi:hypothetical protein
VIKSKSILKVWDAEGSWTTSWNGRASKNNLFKWLKDYALSLRAGEISDRHFIMSKGFHLLPTGARIISAKTGRVLVNGKFERNYLN